MNCIERLSKALSYASQEPLDKEAIRTLTSGIVDSKHQQYIDSGLFSNDRTAIIRGIMGALSHYEAEEEKEKLEKRFHTLHT